MTSIDMIRRSDGRTYYPCGTVASPPTNPKAGTPTSGNTVLWNGRTRVATLEVPRRNPVNIDSWSPQSKLSQYTGPVTYEKPPFRQVAIDPAAFRKSSPANSCPVVQPGKTLCDK